MGLKDWTLNCPPFYFTETFSGHSSLLATSLANVRRRIKAERRSDAWGCCEQLLARTGDEKSGGGRKMQAKALTMLVSRKFSSPPARL
jgi:hypothetical protein